MSKQGTPTMGGLIFMLGGLVACVVCGISAVRDGDYTHLMIFGFAMVFEGKLYLGCGTHKAAYPQMLENPYVELCAFNKGTFVRVRGKAVFDDRPEVQAAMYEAGPFLKDTYNEQTGHHHICFYLEDMSAMEFKGPEAIKLV